MWVVVLTFFTMVAFAANSLFCRMALGEGLIDPASFTALRLLSGTLLLLPLSAVVVPSAKPLSRSSWASGTALFLYAIAFSLAYIYLDTGVGALILFGSVQVTMIGWGLIQGERPHALKWLGLFAALGGLLYLVSPGLTAPSPIGALLMTISGVAWGVYSLRGKGVSTPWASTSGNFLRALPLAFFAFLLAGTRIFAAPWGILLASLSGALTSGLGYVLWYRTVPELSSTTAAMVQLVVPVLAAFGGVLFLSEELSLRLLISAALVLGGLAIAFIDRK